MLALKDNAAAAIRQSCDAVLFANYKVIVKNIDRGSGKATGNAERRMFTECRPAFDAKNRFGLPFEMPLAWAGFGQAVKTFYDGAKSVQETPEPTGNVSIPDPKQNPPEPKSEPAPAA